MQNNELCRNKENAKSIKDIGSKGYLSIWNWSSVADEVEALLAVPGFPCSLCCYGPTAEVPGGALGLSTLGTVLVHQGVPVHPQAAVS